MNNLDKRSFFAIVVFTLVYFGYNHYLQIKYPNMGVPKEILEKKPTTQPPEAAVGSVKTVETSPDEKETAKLSTEKAKVIYEQLPASDLKFDTGVAKFELNQKTGGFNSILLRDYTTELDSRTNVNLVDESLIIQPLVSSEAGPVSGYKAKRNGDTITFERPSGAFQVTHSYTFNKNSYGVDIKINFRNLSSSAQNLTASMLMQDGLTELEAVDGGFLPGIPTGRPSLVASIGDESEHHDALSYCEDKDEQGPIETSPAANINVIGLDRHYFVKALVPEGQKFSYSLSKFDRGGDKGCLYNINLAQDYGRVEPGQNVSLRLKSFFGPKDLDTLKQYDEKLIDTVDLGWFGFLSQPLLKATKILYDLTGNWGIAIILLTVIIKIIFYPLTKSAAVAMHKSKKLQPEMQKLREKFKSDPRRQQQELMAFMSKHQINPMKGCLPMLPQMPVFFALYRVLSTAIELRHAPFMGWIVDLSAADPYYVTPLLWGGTMFIQQKLTPSPGMDKAQQRMMMMLPAVFSVMMITLPSGMVIYMLANTIVSIGQQKWLNDKLDAAEKVVSVRAKKAKA